MGIVVAHQPDPRGIAGMAFNAGLGQFRQQQIENGMRAVQLALQKQQMDQGYQLAQQRAAFDQQQMASQNARFAAELDMRGRQWQQEFNANDAWRQQQLQQQDIGRQFQRQMQAEEFAGREHLMELGFADRERQRLADIDAFRERQKEELTFEGQRFQDQLKRQHAIITAEQAAGRLAPEEAEAARRQINARAAGVDVERFVQPPLDVEAERKKLQQQFEASTFEFDGVLMQRDPESGKFTPIVVKPTPGQQQAKAREMSLLREYGKAQKDHYDRWAAIAPGQAPPPFMSAEQFAEQMSGLFQGGELPDWKTTPIPGQAPFQQGVPMPPATAPGIAPPAPQSGVDAVRRQFGIGGPGPAAPAGLAPQAQPAPAAPPQVLMSMRPDELQQQLQIATPSTAEALQQAAVLASDQAAPPEIRQAAAAVVAFASSHPTAAARAAADPATLQQFLSAVQMLQNWRANTAAPQADLTPGAPAMGF